MGFTALFQSCYYLPDQTGKIKDFYKAVSTPSTFFDDHYHEVKSSDITFPSQKQNLIILCLESTDNTFSRQDIFGKNLVPQMTEIQKNNLTFKGYRSVSGTTWTVASLTGLLYGVPRIHPWGKKTGNSLTRKVFPAAESIFDILIYHGYQITFLQGSDIRFAGKDKLFKNNPGLNIIELAELTRNKKYSPFITDEHNGWGVPDHILFKIAQKQIDDQTANKPFCLFLLTADTHTFYGHVSPDTVRKYNDYRDAICEQDKMVSDFVKYIQKHPAGRNTTIMIMGDHLCPKVNLPDEIVSKQQNSTDREIYTCLINPVIKQKQSSVRKCYGIFDLAPTILESIGATWQSRKLGTGVSLFADEKGTLDIYSTEEFNRKVLGYSPRYIKILLGE